VQLFLSFASPERKLATDLAVHLCAVGHQVFFDEHSLRAGRDYKARIRTEVEACDVFVFLISRASLASRRYTLTELEYRRAARPQTQGNLLPVMVEDVLAADLPAYLRTVTILRPRGDIATEVIDELKALQSDLPQAKATAPDNSSLEGRELIVHERIIAYKRLWESTRQLPRWPRDEEATYDKLRAMSQALRDWYYLGGGGLFLTRSAHHKFLAVQTSIEVLLQLGLSGPMAVAHYEEVREHCSALRTQLTADLGSRV
jgi:hypothetical protein